MKGRKMSSADKVEAQRAFNAKLEKEVAALRPLFEGLLKVSPPTSHKLAEFYETLQNEGEFLAKGYEVDGDLIERPSVSQMERFCREQQTLFLDCSFPPGDQSLYKLRTKAEEKPLSKRPPIVWKRATEFFGDVPFRLFEGRIEPADIKQGALGDCWLMCSLAACAEFPKLVQDIFVGEEDRASPAGAYALRLYKEGLEEVIMVDDYIPCTPEGGPIYSRSNGKELWVILVEKAFAKYNGSYASIFAGKPFEALVDLTGAPFYEFRFNDIGVKRLVASGEFFRRLQHFDREGFIMSISTSGVDKASEGDRGKGPATGILPGHAYTLVSAVELSTGVRLLRIRNPWGNFEWTGDYSDSSPLWTSSLLEEMEGKGFSMAKADDGMFWMTFEDVLQYFVGINVVLAYNPAPVNRAPKVWNTFRHAFSFKFGEDPADIKSAVFLLNVEEAGHYLFSVHQKDRRVLSSQGYFDFGVTVLKRVRPDDDDFVLVASSGNSAERQLQTEVLDLDVGEYWVIPTSAGTKIQQYARESIAKGLKPVVKRYGGLVVHSLKQFSVKKLSSSSQPPALLRRLLEYAVELPVTNEAVADKKDIFNNNTLVVYNIRSGYAGRSYAVVNNTHLTDKKEFYKVMFDFTESKNVISHKGTLTTTVIVAPGETEIAHHIFPEQELGGFTVTLKRTQVKMTVKEIKEYLAERPEIKQRLEEIGITY